MAICKKCMIEHFTRSDRECFTMVRFDTANDFAHLAVGTLPACCSLHHRGAMRYPSA